MKIRIILPALAAALAVVAVFLIIIPQNTPIPPSVPWSQDPPISLPQAVATLDTAQLILGEGPVEGEGTLPFSVKCMRQGEVRFMTTISITHDGHESTTSTSGISGCDTLGQRLTYGSIPIGQMRVSDTVTLTLTARATTHTLQSDATEITHIYRMGTDGQLRQGVASVWQGIRSLSDSVSK